VAGVLSAMIVIGAAQDLDLTLRQYPATYRLNSENASELGVFMKEFVASIGRPEDVYLVPYPYWVDDRIMNIAAGFPIDSKHYVFRRIFPVSPSAAARRCSCCWRRTQTAWRPCNKNSRTGILRR